MMSSSQILSQHFFNPRFANQRILTLAMIEKVQAGDIAGFIERLDSIYAFIEKHARFDELQRVRAVTLDADTDVWSKDDSGQIIPLTERIKQLS
jgi:hypothetical protein